MNKVLISVASAIALSVASFSAAAVTQSGFFIGASAGNARYDVKGPGDYDKTDNAFNALVGWRWVVSRPLSIGVEAGYVDLGKLTYSETSYYYIVGSSHRYEETANAKFQAKGVLAGINAKWDLPGNATITAHFGAVNTRTSQTGEGYVDRGDTTIVFGGSGVHYSDTGIYGGVGFGYDFNRHFGLSLNYDHYRFKVGDSAANTKVNVGVFGIAAEARF